MNTQLDAVLTTLNLGKGREAFIKGWHAAESDRATTKTTRNPYSDFSSNYTFWEKGYNRYQQSYREVVAAVGDLRGIWAWQPFGPHSPRSSASFILPDAHRGGFPVVEVTGLDREHILNGGEFHFRYRTIKYILEGKELKQC